MCPLSRMKNTSGFLSTRGDGVLYLAYFHVFSRSLSRYTQGANAHGRPLTAVAFSETKGPPEDEDAGGAFYPGDLSRASRTIKM